MFLSQLYNHICFLKRLRVLAGSQVVEDISDFGRNMELISSLQNDFVRDNNDIQGFGSRWDSSNLQLYNDFTILDPATLTTAELLTAQSKLLPQIAHKNLRLLILNHYVVYSIEINIYL